MNTSAIDYNSAFIRGMHSLLEAHYNCCLKHIIGCQDTEAKFVAVFILKQFYGYRCRDIAIAYSLPVPYVPTIVSNMVAKYASDEAFRNKLHEIINELEGYEGDVKPIIQ